MQTIIDNASTTFNSTTGLTLADVVSWMGGNLKLILGSGLGLLQILLPWIVALVLIGAIVYFAYRAFRFFRH